MAQMIYGIQPVRTLLSRPEGVERLLIARGRHGKRLREIVATARSRSIPIRLEDRRLLDRLAAGGVHQGVVAMVAALAYSRRSDVMERIVPPALVLVADGVEDPRNLGALLRTAAAAGVHGVFLPERRAVGLTSAVQKAAAGTAGLVPVVREKSLVSLAKFLQENGIWTVAVEAGGLPPWSGVDLRLPTAFVMGGEARGIRPLLRRHCEAAVGLPLAAGVESLNVSVAFGAVVFEALRQRMAPGATRRGGISPPSMK
jgi:23S rRNA (guanosine2251-2'-O)-methyltransferase